MTHERLFQGISKIFKHAQVEEKVALSSEQLEMLAMSEDDIAIGRLISEEDLDKLDTEYFSKQ